MFLMPLDDNIRAIFEFIDTYHETNFAMQALYIIGAAVYEDDLEIITYRLFWADILDY